jgi:hypothetical protein
MTFGVTTIKIFIWEFPSQNTTLQNFFTTQPIQTNINSIDAAQQGEYDEK